MFTFSLKLRHSIILHLFVFHMFILKVFRFGMIPCSIYYKIGLNWFLYTACVSHFNDLRAIFCKYFIRDFTSGCNAANFLAPCNRSNSFW